MFASLAGSRPIRALSAKHRLRHDRETKDIESWRHIPCKNTFLDPVLAVAPQPGKRSSSWHAPEGSDSTDEMCDWEVEGPDQQGAIASSGLPSLSNDGGGVSGGLQAPLPHQQAWKPERQTPWEHLADSEADSSASPSRSPDVDNLSQLVEGRDDDSTTSSPSRQADPADSKAGSDIPSVESTRTPHADAGLHPAGGLPLTPMLPPLPCSQGCCAMPLDDVTDQSDASPTPWPRTPTPDGTPYASMNNPFTMCTSWVIDGTAQGLVPNPGPPGVYPELLHAVPTPAPEDNCPSAGGEHSLSGCAVPSTLPTGYTATTGLQCAADYEGDAVATCSSEGATMSFSGGTLIPQCTASATTGYDLADCSTSGGAITASACTVQHATPNYYGTPTRACASSGGTFMVGGCIIACALPTSPTGYTLTGYANPTSLEACTSVGCASSYAGDATLTCPSAGGTMQFSGCSSDQKCSLAVTSTSGYDTTECNPGRVSTYGITRGQCGVDCAPGCGPTNGLTERVESALGFCNPACAASLIGLTECLQNTPGHYASESGEQWILGTITANPGRVGATGCGECGSASFTGSTGSGDKKTKPGVKKRQQMAKNQTNYASAGQAQQRSLQDAHRVFHRALSIIDRYIQKDLSDSIKAGRDFEKNRQKLEEVAEFLTELEEHMEDCVQCRMQELEATQLVGQSLDSEAHGQRGDGGPKKRPSKAQRKVDNTRSDEYAALGEAGPLRRNIDERRRNIVNLKTKWDETFSNEDHPVPTSQALVQRWVNLMQDAGEWAGV